MDDILSQVDLKTKKDYDKLMNEMDEIFKKSKTIAVVGLSDKPDRDSFRVAQYLQNQGYQIIPVNPAIREVLGQKSYASLQEIPETIDIVDIFRKAEAIPAAATMIFS